MAEPLREDDVIAAIRSVVEERARPRILLGIGDDAAVWQPSGSHRSVITTDALVEGVHFSRATMTLRDAGWRAMTASASDLAAMGARPVLATVALGVAPGVSSDEIVELYRGLEDCARSCGLAIAGGDITRAPATTMAIAAVGEVRPSNLKTRAGARAGDVLAVTGPLGASRAGLEIALGRAELEAALSQAALAAHRAPVARVAQGRWFGASRNVHAMMDCSDGLSTDLDRLCVASGLGALVESVPVAGAARALALERGEDPEAFALAGGEDFELLVAIDARAFAHLSLRYAARFGGALYRIGHARKANGLAVLKAGGELPLTRTGWDHFTA